MGEDMVAKVARAIGDHLYGYVDAADTPATWAKSIAVARLAIQALRDPTEPMMEAAFKECRNNGRVAWQAMIDAALSGAQK